MKYRDFMQWFNRHVARIVMVLAFTAVVQLMRLEISTTSRSVIYMKSADTQETVSVSDEEENRFCTREELREGQWKKVSLDAPLYTPTDANVICPDFESTAWDWVPFNGTASLDEKNSSRSGCVFNPWNTDEFCKIANHVRTPVRPTMALVGDSLTFEQFSSLVQLLGLPSSEANQHKSRMYKRDHFQTVCNWTLVYRRTDALEFLPSVLESKDPNVIVINRGAHYVNDQRLTTGIRQTIQQLQGWQKNCTVKSKTCWLFIRTTVPGHPKCGEYTEPSSDRHEMEALIGNGSNYREGKEKFFHWWDMKHQNELVLDLFSQSDLQYQVLDAYEINILRPDQHRSPDCLHSCYPGKMDVYNQMLLHFLRQNVHAMGSATLGPVPKDDWSLKPSSQVVVDTIPVETTPPVLNCGCPSSCNEKALREVRNNLPFSCEERIKYTMARYQSTQNESCSQASNPEFGACGPECDPQLCGATTNAS